jgi:hypothetical protein
VGVFGEELEDEVIMALSAAAVADATSKTIAA